MGSALVRAAPTSDIILIDNGILTTAADELNFSGLDINSDHFYILKVNIVNQSGSNGTIQLEVNNDTTANNYYYQRVVFNGAGVAAASGNDNGIATVLASKNGELELNISLIGGILYCRTESFCNDNANWDLRKSGLITSGTIANITQLKILTTRTNFFGVGTRYSLYKVK